MTDMANAQGNEPYFIPPHYVPTEEEREYFLLFRQYLHNLLLELSQSYAAGEPFDIYPVEERTPDFNGKIPVFIIWWQGIEKAPELVQMCMESIRQAIPEDLARIHYITRDNYENYVKLPARILSFVEKGTITLTHLSDILRAELLYRYGGFYMDSTFLIRKPLPREWFTEDAFVTLHHPEFQERLFSKGIWTQNFMKTALGDILPRYMRNAFFLYWSEQEVLGDYFLIDLVIDEAYRTIPFIRERFDRNPKSNPHIDHLVHNLNSPYDPAAERFLSEDTFIFKLNYKTDFFKETQDGKETLYGHIRKEVYGADADHNGSSGE